MKINLLIIFALVAVQCIESRHTNKRRSINIFDYISNKTSTITHYVKDKGRSLKNFTVTTANNTISSISSLIARGKNGIYNFVTNKKLTVKEKFKFYIEKAEKTASTIYDVIAPEQDEYKCSDEDSANLMTTPQLVTLHGYYVESHVILTDDGYILTVHRIPFSKQNPTKEIPEKTVLLHHGLLGSSADWIIPGPEKSLAYILSDAGYDVWMANMRGNVYSRAHVTRNADSYAFWNFTFHEVGQFDLPAVIDYIMENKGGDVKINYIGFSMGTTALFALLSTKTQYNDVLRAGFAMAPVAYLANVKTPFKLLGKFGNNIGYFMKLLGANEFLPRNAVVRYLSQHSCKVSHFEEAICEMSMFLLCGHDKEHFDSSLMPLLFGHLPAGASTKILAHYAQEIRSEGNFQQFDYGPEGNVRQYGSATPPEYAVGKITLPIALYSAEDDWLSSYSDAAKLYTKLKSPIEHYKVPDETFNHLDFLFARDAPSLVYNKLLSTLEKSYSQFESDQINVIPVLND